MIPHRKLMITLLLCLMCPMSLVTSADDVFDYQLHDLNGQLHRASDSRGKWLVINFWATWCAPCLKELLELERFYQHNYDTAQLWGVTFEDTDKASIIEFTERLGISSPILGHGEDPLTGYGEVRVLPTTFLINPEGLFQHRFEGPITAQDITYEIAYEIERVR
jgi:thiol-disulfide isomerase/thioredoxin